MLNPGHSSIHVIRQLKYNVSSDSLGPQFLSLLPGLSQMRKSSLLDKFLARLEHTLQTAPR